MFRIQKISTLAKSAVGITSKPDTHLKIRHVAIGIGCAQASMGLAIETQMWYEDAKNNWLENHSRFVIESRDVQTSFLVIFGVVHTYNLIRCVARGVSITPAEILYKLSSEAIQDFTDATRPSQQPPTPSFQKEAEPDGENQENSPYDKRG